MKMRAAGRLVARGRRPAGPGVEGVKSADRAMAVLELFREWRRPGTAREIAAALSMPRSSTTVLLRSLIQGGYLRFDDSSSSYFPTLRVVQLGNWLVEGYLNDPRIDELLRQLVEQTQETVCVWGEIGSFARVLRVRQSPLAISLTVREGESAPLANSAVGNALLARHDDAAIRTIVEKYDRTVPPDRRRPLAQILGEVATVRARGVSVGYDKWLPDAGAIVATLDPATFREVIAVGIGGPRFRIERNEERLVRTLLAALRRFAPGQRSV